MTDRKRRDWAVRYANGTMAAAEREAFEAELGRDERLRTVLNAEMMIAVALEPKSASPMLEHAATRAHVMDRLANLPQAAGTAAKVAGTGGLSLAAKIITSTVLAIGAVSVGYLAVHDGGNVKQPQQVPAVAPAAGSNVERQGSDSTNVPAVQPGPAAQPDPAVQEHAAMPSEHVDRTPQAESTHVKHSASPADAAINNGRAVAAQPHDAAAPDRPVQPKEGLRVIHKDSVGLNVRVARDSTSHPKQR